MKKILLIFFVCLAYLSSAQNVSYSTLYDNTTFNAKAINTTLAVGSTSGTGGVSSGAASYTIPIAIPAGTNGVAPSLSINYNSQAGNGQLGMGWGLSGLSSISRVGQSKFYDGLVSTVDFSNKDRFSLDGSRLVLLSGINYGENNSTYSTKEETFTRVTCKSSNGIVSSFSVVSADGIVSEYGNTTDSKVSDGGTKILQWLINKVTYPNGNYIEYKYDSSNDEHRIAEIKYTGNIITGQTPYNSIIFNYEERQDKNFIFRAGIKKKSFYLLTKIKIYSDGIENRNYNFSYGLRENISFLNEIQEGGINFSPSGVKQVTYLNPTIFKYGEDTVNYPWKLSHAINSSGFNNSNIHSFVDFNNDGFPDVYETKRNVQGENTGFAIHLYNPISNTYQNTFNETLPVNSYSYERGWWPSNKDFTSTNPRNPSIVDLNGDGLNDIYVFEFENRPYGSNGQTKPNFYKTYIYYNNGNGTFTKETKNDFYPPNRREVLGSQPILTGDFDGNGITDIMSYFSFALNNSSTFTNAVLSGQPPAGTITANQEDLTLFVFDFNHDGKSDIMRIAGDKCEVVTLTSANQYEQIYYKTNFLTKDTDIRLGDFNGDGMTDIIYSHKLDLNQWSIAYGTGTGFEILTGITIPKEFVIGDFNGDSKSDLAYIERSDPWLAGEATSTYPPKYSWEVYTWNKYKFSKGDGTFEDKSVKVKTSYEESSYADYVPRDFVHYQVSLLVGDFDGNGITDLMSYYTDAYGRENPDNFYHLSKVKLGTGFVTQWNYKKLNRSRYQKTQSLSYPFVTLNGSSLNVVDEFRVDNGLSGSSSLVQFSYENAILDIDGGGLIGFKKIEEYDYSNTVRKIFGYELNSTYKLLLPYSSDVDGRSSSISSYSVVPLTNNRYQTRLSETNEVNLFEKKSSNTVNTFDNNGLVTNSVTNIYGGTAKNRLIEKITTSSTFGNFGGNVANKPTAVTVVKNRYEKDGTSYTSTESKTYGYNSKGELTSRVDFSNLTQKVTTTYTLDSYGNIISTQVTPEGLSTRTTSSTYDSKGRFVLNTTNVLGQKTTFNYITSNSQGSFANVGNPRSVTGVDGLTTYFEYDVFGQLTKTSVPEGYDIYHNKGWALGNNQLYYTQVDHPYRPNIKTYFDVLGRARAVEEEGWNGNTLYSKKSYNIFGLPSTETKPYYTGEAIIETTYGYDSDNRPNSVFLSPLNNTTTISYTYSNEGEQTITSTDPSGKVSSKVIDPTGKTIASTDNGTTLYYSYNAQGNVLVVKQADGTVLTSTQYDDFGRKTALTDISSGTTSYSYDAAGQLTNETSARGETHQLNYDNNGRVTSRTGTEGTTTTEYYPSGSGAATNAVKKITGFSGETTEYFYDAYGRVLSTKETIDGVAYTTSFTYNTAGDVLSKTFPSGLKQNYSYDANGNLKTIKNGDNSVTIYSHTNENGLGQVTSYTLGNSKSSSVSYSNGLPTLFNTNGIQNLALTWDYKTGNLSQRKDDEKNKTENFTYDNLDRLTSTQIVGQSAINIGFASSGNITNKTDVGTYSYHQTKIHAVTSISNTNSVVPSFNQTISYTAYERPASIAENGYNLNYTYGADYERIKGAMTQNGNAVYTRYFLGDYEKTVSANGTTREIHYISSPAGLIAIIERVNSVDSYHYVYTDHLGSILTVTNSSGNIEAEQNFDAWGRRRNPTTWALLASTAATSLPAWLYRGYTGHEHLDEFGIINMNARLYDPVLGRMISPDNFVNGAFDSQAYNRYSYANNNPLKYTDPSGNHPIIVAMLISATINVFTQVMSNEGFNNFSWSSLGVSVLMGAVSGGMSTAIGVYVQKAGEGLFAQAFLHAWSGGVQSMIFDNDPVSGFVGGAVSSLTAGLIPKSFTDKIGLLGNFALGGTSSALTTLITKGDPTQAFIIGGSVAAFNHYLHGGDDYSEDGLSQYERNKLDPTIAIDAFWGLFGMFTDAISISYKGIVSASKWVATKIVARQTVKQAAKVATKLIARGLKITDRKLVQHAHQWGIANKGAALTDEQMGTMRMIANHIFKNATTIRQGTWANPAAGGFKDAFFYVHNTNIIVTQSDGTMITILKNALGNGHFNKATTIWTR